MFYKIELENKDFLGSCTKHQSSFRAVKNMMEAEFKLDEIQKRIQVMRNNDKMNYNKIAVQKQKIQQLTQIRKQHSQDLKMVNINHSQRKIVTDKLKYKNTKQRQQHILRMQKIMKSIINDKQKQHLEVCKQSQIIHSRIHENIFMEKNIKKAKRNKIILQQDKSKQNVLKYHESKIKDLKIRNQNKVCQYQEQREHKENQIRKASIQEMKMICKQSQSQAAYKLAQFNLNKMMHQTKIRKKPIDGLTCNLSQ